MDMSIRYSEDNHLFTLETNHTAYVFQLVFGQYPVQLYYGAREGARFDEHSPRHMSFSPYFGEHGTDYLPDIARSEYAGFDSGDYRTCSLRVKNGYGDSCTMLSYRSHRIFPGRVELPGLPFADADDNTETLELCLVDERTSLEVSLYYTVFPAEDVISRYVAIKNGGCDTVTVEKCMSLLLDLPDHEYDMLSFWGGHCKERTYQRHPLHYGAQNVFSRRGASSHQFNPFIVLVAKDADENSGNAYGFNFVYSGNFLDEVEVDQTGSTRVQIGLGSENFSWQLKAGESFTSPEAVMTFSAAGIGQMSRNFHAFTGNHILPPEPFDKRPVVLNTWEACYFDIDQQEMLRFADAAAEVGMDMLVMDDGWFGKRNDDRAALGDWWVNREKFPEGLAPFVEQVKSRGIKFGIWIEPEMINPDSELYRAHPDWCVHCPGAERMYSRNQLVLDMGQEAVRDYLKDTFRKTFDGVAIDYFKWDFNRHLSQVASAALPADRQGEAAHRFMLGVYDLYRWFRETYPHVMIENCSGGGGRYDLGMMKYSTMIWTSDNTVPQDRIKIQYGSMLGYPAATMSCHVSNHHDLCEVPKELKYRGEVAMGGALGYELHLPSASEAMKAGIKEQIAAYRRYEDLILRGEYYPIYNPFDYNYSAYCYTDEKRERILLSFLQIQPDAGREVNIPVVCADKEAVYKDEIGGVTYTGEELQKGLSVVCDDTDHNSRMWYLVKI